MFRLLVDSILLIVTTTAKIVLPGKNKKGNMLSTVFALFLGISERIMIFEKNIFQKKRLFSHRLIRQGFIIVTSLLFMLSSVEWTDAPARTSLNASCIQAQTSEISTESVRISPIATIGFKGVFFYSYPAQQFFSVTRTVTDRPIFLLVCNIRI